MDKSKIAILTTVANFELYKKTSQLFPKGIQKYVIDGTDSMHGLESIYYMMKKLKGKGVEWLIMADEDVIFSNSNTVFSIIDDMQEKNITVCGVRDGGVIKHRKQNPWVINTFFSILDFKTVENIWNKNEVKKHQYALKNEFDDDLSSLIEEYDTESVYEPYYCFYFWLRRKAKKILFLEASMHDDSISNKVMYSNEVFLHHTWYARSYGEIKKHTNRINTILDKMYIYSAEDNFNDNEVIIFKDNTFLFKKMVKKIYKKIVG